jgi:hypothetical protein
MLAGHKISIHAVALKKDQVYAHLRADEAFVYRIAFRFLLRSLLDRSLKESEEHTIIVSNYASGKVARELVEYQKEALAEMGKAHKGIRMGFWETMSEPGLQIADYCSWMIQRHLEKPGEAQAVEFKTLFDSHIENLYLPFS